MIVWEESETDDDKRTESVLREHFVTTIARIGLPLNVRVRELRDFPNEYALDLKTEQGLLYVCTVAQVHDLGEVRDDLARWFEMRGVHLDGAVIRFDITLAESLGPT